MLVIALSGLFSRQSLIPKINNYRDAEIAGDKSAKSKFDRLHRLSVGINGGQIILLIVYNHKFILRCAQHHKSNQL